mmetsp:Transcript_19569/g.22163  ORF Transcript_19569/g.22163 Transcript_19569/m.22163 type:complete len:102 (-) Transcript_19569:137-442(-)
MISIYQLWVQNYTTCCPPPQLQHASEYSFVPTVTSRFTSSSRKLHSSVFKEVSPAKRAQEIIVPIVKKESLLHNYNMPVNIHIHLDQPPHLLNYQEMHTVF